MECKVNSMERKTITVVTVCYNAQDTIKDTVESVVNQEYNKWEYIVIDGASKDATLQILSEYENNTHIKIISEPDDGLYYAMNKAIDMACGDYIIFMNSGDVFVDSKVISDIFGQANDRCDLLFGNVIRIRKEGEFREKYKADRRYVKFLLLIGKMICHQAMFIRLDIMKKYKYDTSYKITADFNFLCKCIHDRVVLHYVDRDIVRMDNINGISADYNNMSVMWQEDDRSIKKCFPIAYQLLRPIKFIKRRFI